MIFDLVNIDIFDIFKGVDIEHHGFFVSKQTNRVFPVMAKSLEFPGASGAVIMTTMMSLIRWFLILDEFFNSTLFIHMSHSLSRVPTKSFYYDFFDVASKVTIGLCIVMNYFQKSHMIDFLFNRSSCKMDT